MSEEPTDWAAKTRARKVGLLVDRIDSLSRAKGLDPFGDAEAIAQDWRKLTRAEWHEHQRAVGIASKKPPSDDTIGDVLDRLQRRTDAAGELGEDADPSEFDDSNFTDQDLEYFE